MTLPAASNVVRVVVGRARLAVLIRNWFSQVHFHFSYQSTTGPCTGSKCANPNHNPNLSTFNQLFSSPYSIYSSNYNKSSAVAEMGDRLATIDVGRKVGDEGCCAPFGVAGPVKHNVALATAYLRTKWYPNPSNRMPTIHQRHRQTVLYT